VRFLALSPSAAYALLAGVALVILLLHLLRPPPPRLVVPSLLLWARVTRDRKRPNARRLVSLLLALGAGLSMALALTRPEVPAIAATAQRLTLILDNSPSMAARMHDGRSRWEHAVEQARALLHQVHAPSEVMLMDTAGELRVSGFVDRDSALALLARVPLAAWGNAWIPPMPLAAGAQLHLFTDGVAQIAVPDGAIVHPVFEPADNVAVTAFEARPQAQDPTRYEALVQVLNASPGDQRVRLLVTGGDRFSIAQDLDLRAGETVNATFDVSDFEGGVLGAAVVCQADAFALDDLAYTVVPPHRPKRVLLVTPGNPPLEDALRNLPGVRLTVVPPDGYRRAAQYDAFVFDRFSPAEPPAAGALLLRPPARKWLGSQSAVVLASPRVTGWNEGHAVTSGIAWRSVRLTRASVDAAATTGSSALVQATGSASGALVTAGESRVRWIKVGFALEDSNFPLQADFPVFLGNALSWVTEPVPVLTRGLGSVEVALRQGQVRDGSGNPVAASATAQGIVFEARRPDVYTVSSPSGQVLVVANLPDPRYAMINSTRLSGSDAKAARGGASARFWNAELWMLLLLLAGALLLIEWAVFTRRLAA
jgi:hypothetical protein